MAKFASLKIDVLCQYAHPVEGQPRNATHVL